MLVLVSGCSVTPSCDSDEAKQLAKELTSQIPAHTLKSVWNSQGNLTEELSALIDKYLGADVSDLANVRTMSKDADLGRVECRADVSLDFALSPQSEAEMNKDLGSDRHAAELLMDMDYQLFRVALGLLRNRLPEGNQTVEYSVQFTEDGDLYVEVADVTGFEGW